MKYGLPSVLFYNLSNQNNILAFNQVYTIYTYDSPIKMLNELQKCQKPLTKSSITDILSKRYKQEIITPEQFIKYSTDLLQQASDIKEIKESDLFNQFMLQDLAYAYALKEYMLPSVSNDNLSFYTLDDILWTHHQSHLPGFNEQNKVKINSNMPARDNNYDWDRKPLFYPTRETVINVFNKTKGVANVSTKKTQQVKSSCLGCI